MKRLLLLLLIPLMFQGCFRASYYYVNTDSAQLLENPYAGAISIAALPRNTKVYASKKRKKYYHVSHNGRKGYVLSLHLLDPVRHARYQAAMPPPPPKSPAIAPTESGAAYPASRTIITGPRGGRYYINKNGNKTYIKKN